MIPNITIAEYSNPHELMTFGLNSTGGYNSFTRGDLFTRLTFISRKMQSTTGPYYSNHGTGILLLLVVDDLPKSQAHRTGAAELLKRLKIEYNMWITIVGLMSSRLDVPDFEKFVHQVNPSAGMPPFWMKETSYETMTMPYVEDHVKSLFGSCVAKTYQNSSKTGAIAGGVSAAAVVLFAVAIAFCCWRKKRKRRRKTVEEFRMSHEKQSSKISHNEDDDEHVEVWTTEHKKRYTEIPRNVLTDDWELPRHRLIVYTDAKLGSGAFGSVYKGKILGLAPAWKYYTQTEMPKEKLEDASVAVKSLPEYADEGAKSDFLQEINFMKSLGYNDHVVCLMGCITRDQPLSLLVEMCSNGDLLRFLRKYRKSGLSGGVVNQPQLRDLLSYAWQVCDGMIFLSHKGFIHRDLAARNVFVHDLKIAKIGDFGLCRHVDGDIYTTRGGRLPIKWMAIESLQFYEYTTKSDVWSFGVVLYEIFTLGGVPFPLIQPADMTSHLAEGNRLKQPIHCPDYVYDLMMRCWQHSPLNRPTFEEAGEELRRHLSSTTEEYGYFELMERERTLSTLNSALEDETDTTSQSDTGTEIPIEDGDMY